MIDKKRLLHTFQDLVAIDCESFQERAIADWMHARLRRLGAETYEDDTSWKIGGSSGNLHAWIHGVKEGPPLLFSAHLDTVSPGRGKKAVLGEDQIIRSDGTTVLGADDAAGLAAILEAIETLKEEKKEHRSVELLFSVAEEAHLQGIRHVDPEKIKSREGYVLDTTGSLGLAIKQAPGHVKLTFKIAGQSAHAGIEPEKGVSAITIAANAIAAMRLGRVSDSVTANIGEITGGGETNVVAGSCHVTAECRAYERSELQKQKRHMIECFAAAAKRLGGRVTHTEEISYEPYGIDLDSAVASRFRSACEKLQLKPVFIASGGGSDNNFLQQFGVNGMVIACGMRHVHSTAEHIPFADLITAAEMVRQLILDPA